jgi:osmotically-inducible protein OsmY
MNDKKLRKTVIDELDFEPSIDAADIGVAAENGVITLTGRVANLPQKLAAERAVWRVKGVKAIVEDIRVRLPINNQHHDDDIALRAVNVLAWNTSIPKDAVHVTVQHGWVTLTGEVKWNYQRALAEADVRKLSGVVGVVNDIKLAPSVHPSDVKKRIADALKRHAEVESRRIKVSVRDGGKVAIKGVVANWEERRAVERAVWSAPGVHAVEDHLRIG